MLVLEIVSLITIIWEILHESFNIWYNERLKNNCVQNLSELLKLQRIN